MQRWGWHGRSKDLCSVQISSVAQSCLNLCNPMDCSRQASLSITNSQSLSNSCLFSQWCHPTSHPVSSLSVPAFNLSSIRVFSNESVLHIGWPKYWSFSFNIRPSNEHSGLICFRMDWLDLLPVQGTLKSLLQHHNSKTSIIQCSAFFIIQLSHP